MELTIINIRLFFTKNQGILTVTKKKMTRGRENIQNQCQWQNSPSAFKLIQLLFCFPTIGMLPGENIKGEIVKSSMWSLKPYFLMHKNQ